MHLELASNFLNCVTIDHLMSVIHIINYQLLIIN